MIKAISYIRFSAIHQGKGSTIQRQQELIEQWFKNNPHVIRSDLSVKDRGKSAYKGDHLKHGLGMILEAIEAGDIITGDYILIEAIDRLGRLPILEMFSIIQRIVSKGIIITTLEDGIEYSQESINSNIGSLYLIVGKAQQAHEYSKNLSRRISAAYAKKRIDAKDGKKIAIVTPFWLTSEGILIPEKAEAVRACIDMYLKGYGTRKILAELEADYPMLRQTHPTTLKRWFTNRALIGEWENKGDHITGVFETLINESTFYKLQKQIKYKSKHMSPEETYDLSGIVCCSKCGSRYLYRRKKYKDYVIIYANCATYLKRGKSHCDNNKTWPYEVLLSIFEDTCYQHLAMAINSFTKSSDNEVLVTLRAKLSELNSRIDSLLSLLTSLPLQQNIKDMLTRLDLNKIELEQKIRKQEKYLSSSESSFSDLDSLKELYKSTDSDPIHKRDTLKKVGYKIEGDGSVMKVKMISGDELTYTLIKRSTKFKCYYVMKDIPPTKTLLDDTDEYLYISEYKTAFAINRLGIIENPSKELIEDLTSFTPTE